MALLILAASAAADVSHPYLGSFGPDGTAGTAFGRPGAVAVDQSNGDAYVADTEAGAIYKFGPEGEPVEFSATGSNKLEGLSFNSAEPGLVELAVNSTTHDFYVVENAPVNGVSAFHADGEPAQFSAAASHTLTGFTELCGVAVDSEGDIYAADYEGGISVYDPTGTLVTTTTAAEHVCAVAVGPGGVLYASKYQTSVVRFTPSAYPVTAATTYEGETEIEPGNIFGIAVDPGNGDLYADEGEAIAQFDGSGTLLGRSGTSGEGALGESEGVAVVGSSGRLFATNGITQPGLSHQVFRYGAGEIEQPRVEAEWPAPVGDSEATLNAEVDPRGVAATYHFEYGEGACSSSACASSPEAPLGAGVGVLKVSQAITGLQPSRTYHFRVVVTTGAGSRPGPEVAFRTYAATASSGVTLLDGRGYELVTPGDTGSAGLGVPGPTAGLVNGGVLPERAAADGEALALSSFTAFGEAAGAPPASYYLSRRSASGWAMANITPRDETPSLVTPIRGFSPDLESTGIVSNQALAPGAVPGGYQNLYLRDNATGALRALTTSTPSFTTASDYCVNYIGGSVGQGHVIFSASGGLTPEAPAPEHEVDPNLYEWSAGGGIRLVSLLEDETPAGTGTGLGFGPGNDSCLIEGTEVARHPISEDGSRIFWSQTNPRALYARVDGTETIQLDKTQGGAGPSGNGIFLAASADGSRVFFADPNPLVPGASQGPTVGIGGDLYEYSFATHELTDVTPPVSGPTEVQGLLGASEDGSYVYFVAEGVLAEGAQPGRANLYLDHDGSVSLVARLSRTEDGFDWNARTNQTATVSPDGHHLAFVSVEPLTSYDNALAGGGACHLDSSGKPEGGRGCDEVYLYDVEGSRLSCASCNPTGAVPVGPIKPVTGIKLASQLNTVPLWTTPFEQPRYLSEDGSRLFFLSEEGLVPADKNGEQDVYEFERTGAGDCSTSMPTYVPASEGCLALVSSGRADGSSYFIEAGSNGGDVFFSTLQSLTSDDGDGNYDIYDARVGGESPPPPTAPAPCSGEGCRTLQAPPPPAGNVGTAVAGGEGNVMPRRCPKGKVRHGEKCQTKHRRPMHGKKNGHGKKQNGHGKKKGAGR